jgi:hypothetical protein
MLASPVCIPLSFWQILLAKRMEDVLEQAFEGGCPWKQHSKLWQNPLELYLTNPCWHGIWLVPRKLADNRFCLYSAAAAFGNRRSKEVTLSSAGQWSNKERQVLQLGPTLTFVIFEKLPMNPVFPPLPASLLFLRPFPFSSFCVIINIVYKLFI